MKKIPFLSLCFALVFLFSTQSIFATNFESDPIGTYSVQLNVPNYSMFNGKMIISKEDGGIQVKFMSTDERISYFLKEVELDGNNLKGKLPLIAYGISLELDGLFEEENFSGQVSISSMNANNALIQNSSLTSSSLNISGVKIE